jgi:hypothetical protein
LERGQGTVGSANVTGKGRTAGPHFPRLTIRAADCARWMPQPPVRRHRPGWWCPRCWPSPSGLVVSEVLAARGRPRRGLRSQGRSPQRHERVGSSSGPWLVEVQRRLDGRTGCGKRAAQPVDRAVRSLTRSGAVRRGPSAARRWRLVELQPSQVAAHSGLVGDDRGVCGVGLAVAAVGHDCAVHRDAGHVHQSLAAGEQQRDRQVAGPSRYVGVLRHHNRSCGAREGSPTSILLIGVGVGQWQDCPSNHAD